MALLPVSAFAAATGSESVVAWEPVDPRELEMKDSLRHPGAHTEFLFWRTTVRDAFRGLEQQTYIRAKVYTAQGVTDAGAINFDLQRGERLKSLAARVVKVDGSSTELQKSDFLETEVAKLGSLRVRRTAFAFPNLAPGDIVECRWAIERRGADADGWYHCQQNAPVRQYVWEYAKPKRRPAVSWWNVVRPEQTRVGEMGVRLVARDLPAFVEEPQMPPELDSRGCFRVAVDSRLGLDWSRLGRYLSETFAEQTEPNSAIKRKAAELTAGLASADEKIQRLHEFCRLKIVNLAYSDDAAVQEEKARRSRADTQSPKKTLERGRGTPEDIDLLFAALLRGIGLKPHPALHASTSVMFRTRGRQNDWELCNELCIALARGPRWTFYRPGDALVPFGMNDEFSQGASAFIATGAPGIFESIPCAPASASTITRHGRFSLEADGSLQGKITVTYTGHAAASERRLAREESQETVDRDLATAIAQRLPGAEVSDIGWENLRGYDGPVVVRYNVTVPGYAESTGQRLIITPSYFMRGREAVFTAPQRKNPLFWRTGWTESDDIEFVLPPTHEVEQATAPRGVREEGGLMLATYDLGYSPSRHVFAYKRQFIFDVKKGGQFLLKEAYPVVQDLFQRLHAADQHSIVLRPRSRSGETTAPKAAGAGASGS